MLTSASLLAALAAGQGGAGPTGCFVEHGSSATVKNMCERQFYAFPKAALAADCAALCVTDAKCVMFAWDMVPKGNGPQCRLSSTCKVPTNALVGFQGYFRTSWSGKSCTPAPSPPSL